MPAWPVPQPGTNGHPRVPNSSDNPTHPELHALDSKYPRQEIVARLRVVASNRKSNATITTAATLDIGKK